MNSRQKSLRLSALEIIEKWGKGSSGRVLSSIDLLEGLYFGEESGRPIFKIDPRSPQHPERDLFVLSMNSALPGLYAVLKEKGFSLPELLPELPDHRVPGVELTSHELSYGFSAAVGMAKALSNAKNNRHVFCLMGGEELRIGSTWEAISFAAEEKLDRLCVLLDENDPQDLHIQDRFESFGWRVVKVGSPHDHDEIVFALMKARLTLRKPTCIWAHTVKSYGVPFAERKVEYDEAVFSGPEMEEIRKYLI